MTDGRKIFDVEVNGVNWFIKEMNVEDALNVTSLLARITGTSLFTLIASLFHSKGEADLGFLDDIVGLNDKELKKHGLSDDVIKQLGSLKKYSSLIKKIASIFNIENKAVIQEFIDKIHPKDLMLMSKTMLKDAQYIPKGLKLPENLIFEDYFSATKLPELIKLFLKCLEVNFGNFFDEFLAKKEPDSLPKQN